MTVSPPEQFGPVLRRMREAAGQTQESLAALAGLSARGISDIERGISATPRLETVRLLADGLGLQDDQRQELFEIRNGLDSSSYAPIFNASSTVPIPASSFVGRSSEVESIVTKLGLAGVRLLTLTGPGGVGKSRLSIEVAHRLKEMLPSGIIYVDLSPIRDPESVLVAIASQLGVREQSGAHLKTVLQVALRNREMLLILDNLEQVVRAAAEIAWLLTVSDGLKILVTSRIVLRITAEHVVEIEPMHFNNLCANQQSDAVALFVERASAANGSFELDSENAQYVRELVDRLQGMPLAIELAAARIRMWPVSELLGRLDSQLRILACGAVDAPDRHRSLRDTIAWSFDLLSPVDQAVFKAISIFPVGCTMETAVALIKAHNEFEPNTVMEAIGTLVYSSLVRPREGVDQRLRYRMLVSVREFGLEQLAITGEGSSVRWAAHQAWAEPVALESELATMRSGAVEHLRYLDAERQNLNDHINWLIHHNELLSALNLYGLLSTDRWIRGPNQKARQTMERLLTEPQAQEPTLERLRGLIGVMSDYESADDFRMTRHYLRAAEMLARELNDTHSYLRVLTAQANNYTFSGDFLTAEQYISEIIDLATQNGFQWAFVVASQLSGYISQQRGELTEALSLTWRAFEISHETGSLYMESRAKAELGHYLMQLNRLGEAEEMKLQAHQQFLETEDFWAIPISFADLSDIARLRGDIERARERAERGLAFAHETGSMFGIAENLRSLTRISCAEEDWTSARTHLHQSMHWLERCNLQEEAVRCLGEYAEIELESGSPAFAAWCLGAVDGLFESRGLMRSGLSESEYENLVEKVKSILGPSEWDTHYSAARHLSVEQVLHEVKNRSPESYR